MLGKRNSLLCALLMMVMGCSSGTMSDVVDASTTSDAACAQPPVSRDAVPPAFLPFDVSKFSSDCDGRWTVDHGVLTFDGTSALQQCQYGFTAICNAYINVPIAGGSFPGAVAVRVGLVHSYSLVSGVRNPPLAAPSSVRIMQGAVQLYNGDARVGTPTLLGRLDITGERKLQQRVDFYVDTPGNDDMYVVFTTRLDCGAWPEQQMETWKWSISNVAVTY